MNDSTNIPDFNIELQQHSYFFIFGVLGEYCESFPDDDYKISQLSSSVICVIDNIRKSPCSPENMRRQVKLYFSNYISIFF